MPLGVACRCRGCRLHDGTCGKVTPAALCLPCKRAQNTRRSDRGRTFYHSPFWRRLSAACIARDGACLICERTYRLTAHHLVAREAGGADDLSNLIALCGICHSRLESALRAGRENDQTRALALIRLTRRT